MQFLFWLIAFSFRFITDLFLQFQLFWTGKFSLHFFGRQQCFRFLTNLILHALNIYNSSDMSYSLYMAYMLYFSKWLFFLNFMFLISTLNCIVLNFLIIVMETCFLNLSGVHNDSLFIFGFLFLSHLLHMLPLLKSVIKCFIFFYHLRYCFVPLQHFDI